MIKLTSQLRVLNFFSKYGQHATKLQIRTYVDSNPTNTLQRLKEDMKVAMRAKDKLKLNVIKSIISDVTYAEKSGQNDNLDVETLTVNMLQKAIKKRNDSITNYLQGGRKDLVDNENLELEIVRQYLPEQLSDQKILEEVKKVVEELKVTKVKELGKVLKSINLDQAKAPKAKVATIAKTYLESIN